MTDASVTSDEPDEPKRDALAQADTADDAEYEWLELDVSQPRLADYQFGLIGLFGLVTACGVYFYLEKVHQWKFGLTLALGTVLVVGIAVPALLAIGWVLRTILDRISLVTILMLVLTAAALALFISRL